MQIRMTGALLAGCLLLMCGHAPAQDSETEQLRAQITQLQQQLLQLSQRLEAIESRDTQTPAVSEQPPAAIQQIAAAEPAEEAEEDGSRVEVASNGNLLKFASADGNYEFQIGGRIHADAAVFDEDLSSFGNDAKLRRARIFVSGTLHEDWEFKNQIEFTDGDVSLRDAYLRYAGFDNTKITIGNFKEPFSQEELASSNHIPFIERASINEFAPSRNLGIGIEKYGAYGDSDDTAWNASFGIFTEGISDNGVDPVTGEETDEGLSFTGRFSTALITTDTLLAHLGVGYGYRNPGANNTLSFDSTIRSDIADRDLVSTGTITGVDDFTLAGVEAVGAIGPFSLQGEYIRTSIDRAVEPDLEFDGYYVYGSWFLTGESRAAAYKKSTGVVRAIKPLKPLGDGGWGAWEFVARYGHIDLSSQEVIGGQQDDFTLGVNWYPNDNLRFSLNYVHVVDVEGGANDGDEPDAYIMRAQVTF